MTQPGCMAGAGVVLLLGWMALRVAAGMPDVLDRYGEELGWDVERGVILVERSLDPV